MIAIVRATLPNVQIADVRMTAESWYWLLEDLDEQVVGVALRRILSRQKIPAMPTPGAIRSEVAAIQNPDVPLAADAWAEVLRKVHSFGRYARPKWSHELIAQTVRAIGWLDICNAENIGVIRAHFMRIYDTYLDRAKDDLTMPQALQLHSAIGNLAAGMLPAATKTRGSDA